MGGHVALLAEGVDRNSMAACRVSMDGAVALLAEGVDRNSRIITRGRTVPASPSSRRAWIEIMTTTALNVIPRLSPSSRRAWIEILTGGNHGSL